jgi:hypothetical protein
MLKWHQEMILTLIISIQHVKRTKKNDGDSKFNSLDHTRCCDMEMCQQIHLCDTTLI